MFDSGQTRELDAAGTAAAFAACQRARLERDSELLVLAAHWADLHPAEALPEERRPGWEQPCRLGGLGTPLVGDFCPAEVGGLLATSTTGAANLIADALDLRHRLPRLWARVVAAEVPGWKARQVARATRHLDPAAAAAVDAAVAGPITALAWTRFEQVLAGRIVEADPAQAEARDRMAAAERFVRAGRTSEHGLKLLIARAHAGEVIWFMAMVNRIATILAVRGDPDPVDVRRSKAIGILAQPAVASQLLYDHRDDPDIVDGQIPPPEHEPPPDEQELGEQEEPNEQEAAEQVESAEQEDPAGAGLPASQGHRSIRPEPSPVDPKRLRPPVTLYVHLSLEALALGSGVCRVEDVGPLTLAQLRSFLGDRCTINLKPVIDLPAGLAPVDGYEVPAALREHLHLAQPGDVFPFGVNLGRGQDLDHAVPYVLLERGGPPGQTGLHNLAPMVRYHHRVTTHGHWRRRQPEPGITVWRSPLGYHYLVNASGTHPLGIGAFARGVWRAALRHAAAPEQPANVRLGGPGPLAPPTDPKITITALPHARDPGLQVVRGRDRPG